MAHLHDILLAPVRLRICAYLSGCQEADYKAVQEYCGLTGYNLSKQMTALQDAGLLNVAKVAAGRYTKTRLNLTTRGRAALAEHVAALQDLARDASAGVEPHLSGHN